MPTSSRFAASAASRMDDWTELAASASRCCDRAGGA